MTIEVVYASIVDYHVLRQAVCKTKHHHQPVMYYSSERMQQTLWKKKQKTDEVRFALQTVTNVHIMFVLMQACRGEK